MEYKVVSTGTEWRTPPRVCRCCLSEGCYKDISSEYYWMGEKETYAEMLKECFDLTISLEDVGNTNSRLICEVCITRLRDASNFKKQVVNSEKRFAEHMRTGTGLSAQQETAEAAYAEVKIEGVKDETVISDDDPGPEDDIYDDPDYDESDSLPLKYEVQKKEALGDISFGDEIPTLSNPEMTIRRVSKSKEKPAKKMKLNKKELTIKPVKASGSKAKSAKAAKAAKAAKEPKAAKKGPRTKIEIKEELEANKAAEERFRMKQSALLLLDYTNVCPFKWTLANHKVKCPYCDEVFGNMPELRKHRDQLHANACNQIVFKKKNTRKQQVNVDITDAKCNICHRSVDSLEKAVSHLKEEHSVEFMCEAISALVPFKLCSGKKHYECQLCGEKFVIMNTLNRHVSTHYNKQNHVCDLCGKIFRTVDHLKHHQRNTHGKKFPCFICGEVFPTNSKRVYHRLKVHVKNLRVFNCPHCSERFSHSDKRFQHMKQVHKLRVPTYKCSMCDMEFSQAHKRLVHMKRFHIPCEKNYKCTLCQWSFKSQCFLDKHMLCHTNDRKYQCDICNKAYARKYTLQEHLRIHFDDRRFVCAVCGCAFLQKVSLKQHVRTVHPGEPIPV